MIESDLQLLTRYSRDCAEDAFAEIVRRHLDLVHSAALRQIRSPQLAEEITQSAFTDLARSAHRLKPDTILTAWLYQITRRTAIDVIRREGRRQLREQIATEMNAMNATTADWTNIEPLLDEAMSALDETDRSAVLLRYFENKSLRDVGQALGMTDDAAQKRVSRAVERLRQFFNKHGLSVGASGLVVFISTNAVQAAPIGLATPICTAAALAGTTVVATTTATVTKAIAMTTLQKTLITATIAVAVSTGIYEARQASHLLGENRQLRRQHEPLSGQVSQLQSERDDATNRLAALLVENGQLKSNQNTTELLRLRGEVARLRTIQQQLAQSKKAGLDLSEPSVQRFMDLKAQAMEIARYMQQMPDKTIPELKLLAEEDWLTAVKVARFDTEADIRKTLSTLRSLAKSRMPMGRALDAFVSANNGQLPADISQLKPYFKSALGETTPDDSTLDAILGRYKLLHTGSLNDLPQGAWIIVEKAPADKDYDSRAKFGNGRSTIIGTGIGEAGDPEDQSY